MAERPGDPYRNNLFRVMIDGIAAIDFAEVILPEGTAEIVEYREGGDKGPTRKLVGIRKFSNLTLKRGVTSSNDLANWWKNIANGISDRRNILVALLDNELNEVKSWKITNAWPCRFAVSPLIAGGEACVLIETLECAVEGWEVAS
jgi:phage tail-like protein